VTHWEVSPTEPQLWAGIQSMWLGSGGWAVYKDAAGNKPAPNFGTWYPDASSQLYPVLHGVVSSSESHAKTVYTAFKKAWPSWPSLSFTTQDPFAWVTVAAAAARMGDSSRVNSYITTIQNQSQHGEWPMAGLSTTQPDAAGGSPSSVVLRHRMRNHPREPLASGALIEN
jgi:hypothetical protein